MIYLHCRHEHFNQHTESRWTVTGQANCRSNERIAEKRRAADPQAKPLVEILRLGAARSPKRPGCRDRAKRAGQTVSGAALDVMGRAESTSARRGERSVTPLQLLR